MGLTRSLYNILLLIIPFCLPLTLGQYKPELPTSFDRQSLPPASSPVGATVNRCNYLRVSAYSQLHWTCNLPVAQTICGQPAVVEEKCCPGYIKSQRLNEKCGQVMSVWKNATEFMRSYIQYYDTERFARKLEENGGLDLNKAYTVFAPKFENEEVYKLDKTKATSLGHPIMMHVVNQRIYTDSFVNGAEFRSSYGNMKIRITTYSSGLAYANCRAILTPDVDSSNAVIHYINGILQPTRSLYDTMQSVANVAKFFNIMPDSIKRELQNPDSSVYTVFAPSNEAMDKMGPLDCLIADDFWLNHVVKQMVCSESIIGPSSSMGPSLEGSYLGVDCTDGNTHKIFTFSARQSKILIPDISASNGVLHVMDDVIPPSCCHSLVESLQKKTGNREEEQIQRWLGDFQQCGVSLSGKNNIVLVWTDKAYKWLSRHEELQDLASTFDSDRSYLCQTLKYNVFTYDKPFDNFDGVSFSGLIGVNPLQTGPKVYTYYVKYRTGSRLFFGSARTIHLKPHKFRNGIMYFVDRINILPKLGFMAMLESDSDLSTTAKHVSSYYASELSGKASFVFLASSNKGWKSRKEDELTGLNQFFQLHTIDLPLFGGSIGYLREESIINVPSRYQLDGKPFNLQIKRDVWGRIYVGHDQLPFSHWSLVTKTMMLTKDSGHIWKVDWPMQCPGNSCGGTAVVPSPATGTLTLTAVACDSTSAGDLASVSESERAAGSSGCTKVELPPISFPRLLEVPPYTSPSAADDKSYLLVSV